MLASLIEWVAYLAFMVLGWVFVAIVVAGTYGVPPERTWRETIIVYTVSGSILMAIALLLGTL